MIKKNKLHIKHIALLFLLTICFSITPFSLIVMGENDSGIDCQSSSKAYAVYLYNIETDSALFEKNIHKKISPASTVKLMTAMVAFDKIGDISKKVTLTEQMIGDVKSNTMKLNIGENIKISDLFAGLVCSGYNDAANALAVISCGSVSAFVSAMNKKAEELGALDTVYVDPTGIDDSAQTTAYDTMLIAKTFMAYEHLLTLSKSPTIELSSTNMSEARTLSNRNAMISNRSGSKYLNSSALGMNAGMTSGGGYCVVTAMKQEDMTYICVVMGAKYDDENDTVYSYVVANELLSYINKNLGYRTVLESSEEICSLPVTGAAINKKSVSVIAKEDVKVYLPSSYNEGEAFSVSYIYSKDKLIAPVAKGDSVGKIVVRYRDNIVFVTDLVAAEDVPRNGFMYSMERIRGVVFGRGSLASLICFALLFLGRICIYQSGAFFRRKRIRKNIKRYR